jgi:excinuclease ABC subunit A
LQNIDVDIPKNKLVVITGLSGSGKSSLAFDTLYAEGQRRYLESLSAYARQFLGVMQKPEVDRIEGISPSIAIDQRKAGHNPRSTVGTITEIYDYLRLLFARIGQPHCPNCKKPVARQTIDQISSQVLRLPGRGEIMILGPVVRGKKGEHIGILEEIKRAGFVRVRIDGIVSALDEALERVLDKKRKHDIEVVVDRLVLDRTLDKSRLTDSLETALRLGKGIVAISTKSEGRSMKYGVRRTKERKSLRNFRLQTSDLIFSEHFACEECGISLPELEPRLFSFNSPYGACPSCQGLGEKLEVDPKLVIPNPNLTLGEGAVFPWARASHKVGRQGFFWWRLTDLAKKHNFPLDVPVKELSKEVINLVLYGESAQSEARSTKSEARRTKDEEAKEVSGLQASDFRPQTSFEGVIPWLKRKFHETDSDYARQEIEQYMVEKICETCQGQRLKPEALAVTINGQSIADLIKMPVSELKMVFEKTVGIRDYEVRSTKQEVRSTKSELRSSEKSGRSSDFRFQTSELRIAHPIVKEIINRLQFLVDVGLDYLTLERKASSLAGGEEQRIRLATQLGSQLTGVLYILDEPSIGLHPRDQGRLIETLKKLRDLGNTVIVVEHDPQTIRAADWVIDIGPGAGKHGGRVIFTGTPKELLKAKTLTGDYLAGRKRVQVFRKVQQPQPKRYLIIKGAKEHNLKNINVKIPLGNFVCVTGVSGSGKSSLINDVLAKALLKKLYRAKEEPGSHETISGTEYLNKVVLVDQSPIGRTPRSNPATYTNAFSYIRELFTKTKQARIRGFRPGRFSFNVKGGRCEACEGQGEIKIEMYFLPDVYQECQECHGKRFNQETLSVEYIPFGQSHSKNIAQVLEMTVEEAMQFFKNIPGLLPKLQTLNDVGLGYLQLGQPAPSLSGGEAQRIKLATELSRRDTGRTLYILDEPTTGLHFEDVKKLVEVLRRLADKGNTILVIEHNLELVKNCDWIIDLGPEGGEGGGEIVAEGTSKEISENKKSYTGQYLKYGAQNRE